MSNERFDIYATSDQSLAPGDARCPGPSPQDMLNRDMDTPPDALKQVKYEYLGSDDIPLSRYTDEAFYLSEVETCLAENLAMGLSRGTCNRCRRLLCLRHL